MRGSAWKPLRWAAAHLEHGVCAAVLATLVVIVSISVVSRYVFNAALPWPDELARFLLVALTFFGAALAMKRNEHVAIDFLGPLLPRRAQLWMALGVQALVAAFLAFLLVLGAQMVDRTWVVESPALSLRMGWVYLCVPLGTGLMLVHVLQQLRQTARALHSRQESPPA